MDETVLMWVVSGLGVLLVASLVVMWAVYRYVRRIQRGAVALWELTGRGAEEAAGTAADDVRTAESEPGQGG